jgi:hypothetical protein
MMKDIFIITFIFCSSLGYAAEPPTADKAKDRLLELAVAARTVANLPNDASLSDRSDALRHLEALLPDINEPAGPVCSYVRNASLMLAGQKEESEQGLLKLTGTCSVAPEAILGLSLLRGAVPARRIEFENLMALILPVSRWGRWRDGQKWEVHATVNPSPPSFPDLVAAKLFAIADQFEKAGMYDCAWRAYAEALYVGLGPSWINEARKDDRWFSLASAELWAKAAQNAWKAGERSVAYDYLAKSVVFGPPEQLDKAKAMLLEWQDPEIKPREVDKKVRQNALEQIIALYAEMNAHPRSLEIIDTYRDSLPNADELQAKYAAEWTALVNKMSAYVPYVAARMVLYGTEIKADTNPTAMRIPPPLSPDGLAAAQKEAAVLLGKQ